MNSKSDIGLSQKSFYDENVCAFLVATVGFPQVLLLSYQT